MRSPDTPSGSSSVSSAGPGQSPRNSRPSISSHNSAQCLSDFQTPKTVSIHACCNVRGSDTSSMKFLHGKHSIQAMCLCTAHQWCFCFMVLTNCKFTFSEDNQNPCIHVLSPYKTCELWYDKENKWKEKEVNCHCSGTSPYVSPFDTPQCWDNIWAHSRDLQQIH